MKNSVLIFIGVCLLGFIIGGLMAECVYGGIVTLLGFYFLCEFVRPLKWCIYHYGRLVDIVLFVFTLYASIHFGVTIALSFMIASFGYTTVLVPYIRETYYSKSK